MTQRGLVIGEAVEVELPVARLATRAAAIAIDATIQIVMVFSLATLLSATTSRANAAVQDTLSVLLVVFVFVFWPIAFETFSRGRSPGKFALGLRVVRDDGGPIRFRHAVTRGLIGVAIEWPGLLLPPLTWIFGSTCMLFSARGKRLGDLAAGTIVLVERLPDLSRRPIFMPPELERWARDLDLAGVDDALAMTLRQFITRAPGMRAEARTSLERRLAAEVYRSTTPPPPPGTQPPAYLKAVVAERRRREAERLAARRALVALGAPGLPTGVPGQANSVSPQ
ncbi:RDD family protein [Cryptosporangium phraense]|uniref:RDD family protein n=1 Tax=Cryptosporangium phraense TaxID=2593070 RepID=UPI001478BBEC|nr:RDD family protein [Cryptosporangium phraense]